MSFVRYAQEEIASTARYPKNFHYYPVGEQALFWERLYPRLDARHVSILAEPLLPAGAEDYIVFPKPKKLGGDYIDSIKIVLGILALHDRLAPSLGINSWKSLYYNRLCLISKTQRALSLLCRTTPGDFLVVPVQLGKRHRGRSIRRARACFADNEFGLGAYEALCALLVHPERLSAPNQFLLDCPGTETGKQEITERYAPKATNLLCLSRSKLYIGQRPMDLATEFSGSASGFLPS